MSELNPSHPQADLTSCDREPIHVPGTIQPTGGLLVLRPSDWTITHASANIQDLLFVPPGRLIGQTLAGALGREVAHRLTNALTTSLGPSLPGRAFGMESSSGSLLNAAVHLYDDRILAEFEPAIASRDDTLPLLLVRAMLTRMQQSKTTVEACEAAVDQLRTLIGFDRVMVYQFLQDGSGCVIAEKVRLPAQSYLGHHYPASDIPVQARALYIKNWIRTIADVNAVPVPVLPAPTAVDRPVDLSFCGQRSVSPVHIEYLKNMDVAASMSISIVLGGKLWGLIACHHSLPRAVAAETRIAAELFGQAFSLHLHAIERLDATELLRAARGRLDILASTLPSNGSLLESLRPRLAELASILPCDGAGIWIGGEWHGTGAVPPADALPSLAKAIVKLTASEIFSTHQLSAILPGATAYADQASGVLAVPVSHVPGDYLLFFRREFIHSISWAGRPDKGPAVQDGATTRLSPRKSFETWKQDVRHTSKVWEAPDQLAAEALRITLLEIVLRFQDVVATERAKSAEQQRVFVAELNHRVKNALALVGALVKQSQNSHQDIGQFVADLEGRILSLARAHDQATIPGARDLRHLIETELAPFQNRERRIIVDGPPVLLDHRAFAVLALVFHEMTTNAVKHGALSTTVGGVAVHWDLGTDGACHLFWRETSGPPVTAPRRNGFGWKLIEHQIPFELGGAVTINFDSAGVRISMQIPGPSLVAQSTTPVLRSVLQDVMAPAVDQVLTGCSLLVVEDSLLVALETEDVLRKAGASQVTLCSTVAQALAYLSEARPDVTVLDINLASGTSIPVAEALIAAGLPFIFATGYGSKDKLPAQFRHVTVITKPYRLGPFMRALQDARLPMSR